MVTTHYTVSFDGVPFAHSFYSMAEVSVFAETYYITDRCSSYTISGHDEYSEDDKTPEYGRTYFYKCAFRK